MLAGVQVIFDWHVSIGTIVEVFAILCGGLFFMWSMKSRVDSMGQEVSNLRDEIKKLSEILIKLAVQDQRILGIEQDIKDLRHGVGFIVKPPFG